MAKTTTTRIARDDESGFRANAPEWVSGFRILEVRRFKAGSITGGTYAAAVAITEHGDEYTTHILVHADDRPVSSGYRWYLTTGHYFDTREDAEADAGTRYI